MGQGLVSVFYGDGRGKSAAAVGEAVRANIAGKSVVVIEFLKGKQVDKNTYMQSLEPGIKWFTFEKEDVPFDKLPEEKKKEALSGIQNGIHFAKKVISLGEYDMVVLDEVLGLIDNGFITAEDIKDILNSRMQETDVILTGIQANKEIMDLADTVSKIEKVR